MSKQMTKEDYNNIPVHYCKGCLFIGNTETVNVNDEEIEYCPQCGSTEFSDCHIDEWERRFEFKYKQGKLNNGKTTRPSSSVKAKKLEEENANLKKAVNELYNKAKQMENTWVLARTNFLMKVVETSFYSDEFRKKAAAEIEEMLYPTNETNEE